MEIDRNYIASALALIGAGTDPNFNPLIAQFYSGDDPGAFHRAHIQYLVDQGWISIGGFVMATSGKRFFGPYQITPMGRSALDRLCP